MLWWLMLAVSSAVVVVVGVLVLVGALRRRRSTDPDREPRWSHGLMLGGGVIVPLIVLSSLWAFTLRDMAALSEPCDDAGTTIRVVGEMWWWRVLYEEPAFETANEIHIPAEEPVRLIVESADVIHSFWVPQLGVKMDMVPGRTNQLCVQADSPGVYRGQCAEFCGVQHANMAFYVVAQTRPEFEAWMANEAADAAPPTDAVAARGRDVFLTAPCAACHVIRGVSEDGVLGPDLTHVGSRATIGAGTAPNDLEHLLAWIPNAQEVKPGNRMPPVPLSTEELDAVARYLEGLE